MRVDNGWSESKWFSFWSFELGFHHVAHRCFISSDIEWKGSTLQWLIFISIHMRVSCNMCINRWITFYTVVCTITILLGGCRWLYYVYIHVCPSIVLFDQLLVFKSSFSFFQFDVVICSWAIFWWHLYTE